MIKYLTRVETSSGYETYRLLIESEKEMTYSEGFYYIYDALISKVDITQSDESKKVGPFAAKQFYQKLRFPIHNTIVSEQMFEYGETKTENNN